MSRHNSLRNDPGYWLCGLLLILCPPLLFWALVACYWEDRQAKRQQRELDAKCGGNHKYRRDPSWNLYRDIQYAEWSCDICRRPAPEGYPDQIGDKP